MKPSTTVLLLAAATFSVVQADQLQALVYRGPASCAPGDPNGCSELAAKLLRSSPSRINVTFVGPNEAFDISAKLLNEYDIYVQPGGGDLAPGWRDMKKYAPAIREFVAGGGKYLGFCLGAYLAGPKMGFNLLPKGDGVSEEVDSDNSQVRGYDDTIIQVDWQFSAGNKKGSTAKKQWLYFQDGAVMDLSHSSPAKVLGRYSANGDVASSLSQFGDGWVGLIGPHPEASKEWYNDPDLKNGPIHNPQGIHHDIGWDLVEAIVHADD